MPVMNKEEINKKVVEIIVDKLAVSPSMVTLEATLAGDLSADSLDVVEMILEFERVFNISIPDDQAEKIKTVGQIVDYLYNQVGK